MFKRLLAGALVALTLTAPVVAQVTVPFTLTAGTTIKAGDLNTNFSTLGSHALDRLSGGTISGNITLDPGITIDGIDLSVALCSTCAATHASLTLTGAAAITGSVTAGSVIVNGITIIPSSGKIPALSASYFTSIDGSALTNLTGGNIATGTVAAARLGSGSPSAANFLRGDGAWSSITATNLGYVTQVKSALYTAITSDEVILANGTFTITLYTCVGNANRVLIVKNTGTGTITIDGNAAETIDGALTFANSQQYQANTFVCDGANWSII